MSEAQTAQARRAEKIEAAAYRELIAAAPADFARATGLRSAELAGATLLIAPGIPDTLFNRAIGLGVHRPAAETDLDAVIRAFREAGCRNYWIHLAPCAEPESIARWLEARGFAPPARRSWAKMVRGVERPPELGAALEVGAAAPEERTAAAEAIRGAFGMPPAFVPWLAGLAGRPRWRLYAARAEGRVVGGAFLYVEDRCAWLGAAGVQKEFRGRGAQRALMALRIREAGAAGCGEVHTETGEPVAGESNPSLANMQRCGFARICSRLNYAPPA
jgi:GNAT superfamily N-acetyltransferase